MRFSILETAMDENNYHEKLFRIVANGDVVKMLEMITKFGNYENILMLRDKKGRQLSHVAAKKGNVKCLLELIKHGCEMEEKCFKGNNVLHYACVSGSLPCIVIVLETGGKLRTPNVDGKTPLDLLPDAKQTVFGNILRQAEQRQKLLSAKKTQTGIDEASLKLLLGEIPLLSKGSIALNLKIELVKGPEMSCCRGEFNSIPVMVKYNNTAGRKEKLAFSLKNEIIAVRNLGNHPNILQLLGVAYHDHRIQLVFELPNFGYLHRALFQSKLEMNSSEILSIGRDISNALQYIHGRGYVHCAVASYSVILSKTLQAKICNLNYVQKKTKATSISHIPCLYPYMATKQRQGYPCDEANDVHGLGVILYECATLCKIQIVEREMKTQDEKMELARKMKQVPKTHVGAVATLIEECLSDVKQPTSMKVYEWLDAMIETRFTTSKPFDMENEELVPLQL